MTRTLQEIAELFQLFAACTSCRRTEALDVPALIERFGPDYRTEEVRRRVRCDVCGRLTGQIRIVYVGACGSAGSFHYRD